MRHLAFVAIASICAPAQAAWETSVSRDPLENQATYFASLKADRTIIARSRRPETHSSSGILFVQCNAKRELSITFGVPDELVSSRRTFVQYRFDGDDAKETWFRGSDRHDFGGLWNIRGNNPFLLRLRKSNALIIRLTEPVWGSVEFQFTTLGAAEALTPEKLPCMKRK